MQVAPSIVDGSCGHEQQSASPRQAGEGAKATGRRIARVVRFIQNEQVPPFHWGTVSRAERFVADDVGRDQAPTARALPHVPDCGGRDHEHSPIFAGHAERGKGLAESYVVGQEGAAVPCEDAPQATHTLHLVRVQRYVAHREGAVGGRLTFVILPLMEQNVGSGALDGCTR